tara:strand:- start:527 stop:1300 length:774 start_codon:yes stop_codon:yes gene_type:complete
MGIFRDITKSLKKAAPIIGGTIGFALGGPTGAAIGSGIGSLAGGRSVEESLMNAALGYGAGSLAQGAGFGSQAVSSGAGPASMATKNAAMGIDSAAPSLTGGSIKIAPSGSSGVMSGLFDFAKANPLLTTSGVLSLAALAGGDDKKGSSSSGMRPYPKGDVTLGTGIIGEGANRKSFNLNDEAERKAYFTANQNRGFYAVGGEVTGPGTGTSDSVPARLSDGEFVVTADAVRGAGGGDRNVGAARMYDMMSQLERVA